MTRTKLINKLHVRSNGFTKKQIEQIVNVVFDSIKNALAQFEKVEIRGFGSFRIREKNARISRNPGTGETVEIPPKKALHFKIWKGT